jgi:Asp-tRNA(Asn)/Glu-tRNA(Gln) amidotransferase A subunit family amidase
MALSWTMDKIGPMCRSVEDCALVFNAIYGPDGRDDSVVDAPFTWNPDIPLSRLRIAYLKAEFEAPSPGRRGGRGEADPGGTSGARGDAPAARGRGETPARGRGRGGLTPEQQRALDEARLKILNESLDVFRQAGATLHPIELPATQLASTLGFILSVEAAAAFDDLTRSKDIADPSFNTWPNTFRTHRYVPAVEYIRAQRARTLLMREMDKLMREWDVLVSPAPGSASLLITNLTGHPQVVVPCGFINNLPQAIMFTGGLYDEGAPLRVAHRYQQSTRWHTMHPKMDW